MRLALEWRKITKDIIEGYNELLPDNYCTFEIQKIGDHRFQLMLAGRTIHNRTHKIIVNCPELARDICENYLNDNLKQILRVQIKEMNGSSAQTIKPAHYYSRFLEPR